jgi:hypothetical protein
MATGEKGFREVIETTILTKDELRVQHRGPSLTSPVHWMIVSTLTTVFQDGGRLSIEGEIHLVSSGLAPAGTHIYICMLSQGKIYELGLEARSKLHLTTRMVISSLKSSPQKSAAAL